MAELKPKEIIIHAPLDVWLDLNALETYSSLSKRTLARRLHSSTNPLPHKHVGAKVLVRKSQFDLWVEREDGLAKNSGNNLQGVVDEVIAKFRTGPS